MSFFMMRADQKTSNNTKTSMPKKKKENLQFYGLEKIIKK